MIFHDDDDDDDDDDNNDNNFQHLDKAEVSIKNTDITCTGSPSLLSQRPLHDDSSSILDC
jgi:hypothetical protein